MLKTQIDLVRYENLERVIGKFQRSNKRTIGIYDDKVLSEDNMCALNKYLQKKYPDTCITIIDISTLPKDAKMCLIASKDES